MTNSFHSYTYDAEGNLTAIDYGATATYQYDALNRRVQAGCPIHTPRTSADGWYVRCRTA